MNYHEAVFVFRVLVVHFAVLYDWDRWSQYRERTGGPHAGSPRGVVEATG